MRRRNKSTKYENVTPLHELESNKLILQDINPLVNDTFKTMDNWRNSIASIGENNSLIQYNNFLLNRLSYAECANMSTDPIINKAINTITNEIFSKSGVISFKDDNINQDFKDDLLNKANNYFLDNDIIKVIKDASVKALQFGGAYIYIDTSDVDLSEPLLLNSNTTKTAEDLNHENKKKLLGFKVLEAWQVTPILINNVNPLENNYMYPEKLYIIGGNTSGVHYTRLIPVIFFQVPYLIKPLFNYLGLSLTQLMKDYVSNADVIRQSLSDLFLKFRSLIIKTNAHNISDINYKARVKFIAESMNNNGVLLLSNNEELQQLITPITGLDNIQSQAYELMVATSGIPATKLLGISPRGFNSTGEHDLKNYYDNIVSYQNNIFKSIVENIYQIIFCYEYGFFIKSLEYKFNPLGQSTDKELAEIRNLNADYLTKLKSNDIISDEEALESLKNEDFNFNNINLGTLNPNDNYDINSDDEINELIKTLKGNNNE